MKQLFFFAGISCLIAMLVPACTPPPEPEPEAAPEPVFDQAAEEAAIRNASEHLFAMANKHDAGAFAACVVENYENWTATERSREDFKEARIKGWESQPDVQINLTEEIGIIFLTPNVAIHKYHEEYVGRLDAEGKPIPTSKGMAADIYVKKNGKWLVQAFLSRPTDE